LELFAKKSLNREIQICANNFTSKIVSADDKNREQNLKVLNENNMRISVDGTFLKILASKFLLIVEIMMKRC